MNLSLMANLRDYMSRGKEWILDSGCIDHVIGDKDMFHELAKLDVHASMSLLETTPRVWYLASVRWPFPMIALFKMLC